MFLCGFFVCCPYSSSPHARPHIHQVCHISGLSHVLHRQHLLAKPLLGKVRKQIMVKIGYTPLVSYLQILNAIENYEEEITERQHAWFLGPKPTAVRKYFPCPLELCPALLRYTFLLRLLFQFLQYIQRVCSSGSSGSSGVREVQD